MTGVTPQARGQQAALYRRWRDGRKGKVFSENRARVGTGIWGLGCFCLWKRSLVLRLLFVEGDRLRIDDPEPSVR